MIFIYNILLKFIIMLLKAACVIFFVQWYTHSIHNYHPTDSIILYLANGMKELKMHVQHDSSKCL